MRWRYSQANSIVSRLLQCSIMSSRLTPAFVCICLVFGVLSSRIWVMSHDGRRYTVPRWSTPWWQAYDILYDILYDVLYNIPAVIESQALLRSNNKMFCLTTLLYRFHISASWILLSLHSTPGPGSPMKANIPSSMHSENVCLEWHLTV